MKKAEKYMPARLNSCREVSVGVDGSLHRVVRDVWRRGLWKAVCDRDLSAMGRDRSGGLELARRVPRQVPITEENRFAMPGGETVRGVEIQVAFLLEEPVCDVYGGHDL